MKYKLIQIISGILVLFGIFGFLFFHDYNGTRIPYSNLCYALSIAFILLGIAIYLKTLFDKKNKLITESKKEIADFIKDAIPIHIEFDNCKIIKNKYDVNVVDFNDIYTHNLDYLFSDHHSQKKTSECQSVILYEMELNGQLQKYYSSTIYKDSITLGFTLDKQKSTTLYIDKTDSTKFYFDLEFLKKS